MIETVKEKYNHSKLFEYKFGESDFIHRIYLFFICSTDSKGGPVL